MRSIAGRIIAFGAGYGPAAIVSACNSHVIGILQY